MRVRSWCILMSVSTCLVGSARRVSAQVSVSLQAADLTMIPSAERQVYAEVRGTDTLEVRWSVTGGCLLGSASTNASPQTVRAPEKGGKCLSREGDPTNENPSFRSPVSCRITARSAANPAQSASIVIPVCAPAVHLSVFPEATVLFPGQPALVQSDLRGSTDTGVTWSLAANPGGKGTLSGGAANRHAVFTASAPGVYVLTASSHADPQKKAASTIRVTEGQAPAANADHTETVNCSVAPPAVKPLR